MFLSCFVQTYSRSPRALSPTEPSRENIETTFDLEGNVETISTASGAREDNRSLGSSSENRSVVCVLFIILLFRFVRVTALQDVFRFNIDGWSQLHRKNYRVLRCYIIH